MQDLSPSDHVEALRNRASQAERDFLEAYELYRTTSPRVPWMRRDAKFAALLLRDRKREYDFAWRKFCAADRVRRMGDRDIRHALAAE
jgi:hypothetical protein